MRKKKQSMTEEIGIHPMKNEQGNIAASSEKSADEVWERLIKIREKLGKGWQSEKSAVEILSEMRW